MKKFTFFKDTQMKVWKREKFVVEAENIELAKQRAAGLLDETLENAARKGDVSTVSSELLTWTLEDIGYPGCTILILDEDENLIAEN